MLADIETQEESDFQHELDDYSRAYLKLLEPHEVATAYTPTGTLYDDVESAYSDIFSIKQSSIASPISMTDSNNEISIATSVSLNIKKSPKVKDFRVDSKWASLYSSLGRKALSNKFQEYLNEEISENTGESMGKESLQVSISLAGRSVLVGVEEQTNDTSLSMKSCGRVVVKGVVYDFNMSSEELF
ncbi:hypothetical protein BABINDRAFT_159635, partial [Babjeviella inositovora NRRL Y-12698]